MIRAVLFDNDGTLLDTYELIASSFRYAISKVLGQPMPDHEFMKLVGIPLVTQMQIISPEHADELVLAYREHNETHHDSEIHEFVHMRETLDALAEQGVRMCVVSSKRHALVERGFKVFDYLKYFEFIIGSDDCEKSKPDPAPVKMAADRLGITPAECLYVGDSPYDMDSGNGAGTVTAGVRWGMFTEGELAACHPDFIIGDPKDILGIVDGTIRGPGLSLES